jgi:serine/threonine-protein kinase
MGVVYEVEHLRTGQRLALKVLSSQPRASVERFKREARAASLIRSDHIVLVTDADVAPELNDSPYLVMELLEGSDLGRATGEAPTPPAEVVGWLRQVARALAKAHEAGLVHRDLKPENLFLSKREDGTPLVKLLDFGIAKMTLEGEGGLTTSDTFLGTPGYMAPEQMDSRGPPVTLRADLYALGLIAFRLLTGRSYWRPGTLVQLVGQIIAEPLPPASERGSTLGPEFDAWFARATDRNADKRFASAEEQVEALARVLGVSSGGPSDRAPAVHSSARPLPAAEKPEGASLNGSASDLVGSLRRVVRRRVVGGVLVAGVIVTGAAAWVVRRAPPMPAGPPSGEIRPVAPAISTEPVTLRTLEPAPNTATASALPAASVSESASVAILPAPPKALPRRPVAPVAPAASSAPPQPSTAPPPIAPSQAVDPLTKLRRL